MALSRNVAGGPRGRRVGGTWTLEPVVKKIFDLPPPKKNNQQQPSARERDVVAWEVELAAHQAVAADHVARAAALDMRRPALAGERATPPSPPYRRGRLHPPWGSPGVGRPTHHRPSSRMGGEGQVAAAIS